MIVPFFDGDLMGWVWLSGLVPGARLSSLRNASVLGEVDAFARRIGPVVRTMLRIRSLAEQERLATLGELSAGLAHEIRNPLGAIRGALDLMPSSEWTGLIRSETDRLEGLVRQFLELSRRRDQEMEWIDPSRWIGQIRARLAAHDLHWPQFHSNGAGFVGDPERLLQVIENWVQNSRQAGAREIRVGVVSSQDARELGIFVEDDGEGIAESDQQRIFAPFFTTRREGTGLGLSICRQIAQNHDGRIQVSSEPGKGSRFVLWLPAAAREAR